MNGTVKMGDMVKIKGVRSHLNGRLRACGDVVALQDGTATVDCGTRVYVVDVRDLVRVPSVCEERGHLPWNADPSRCSYCGISIDKGEK